MNTLKGSSLKIWLYLNKNQERYTFDLSRAACLEWGIKKDSYYDGIKELMEKGYLVQSREGSNYYTFYESPQSVNQNSDKTNNYFSEDSTLPSGKQNWGHKKPKESSANQYRNNIYNTEILQDNTYFGLPEKAYTKDRLGF